MAFSGKSSPSRDSRASSIAMGASVDARSKGRTVRDDSAFDLIEVPATVVCAGCGDPACSGCVIEQTNQSGVVAIIPWERPGLGFWRRLWQTSTLATLHARTFFSALPEGEVSTALSFALVCEAIAVSGLGLGGALIALLILPALPGLMWDDPALRSGFAAARSAVPLGLTAPAQASEAFLVGMHGLSPETARLAARRAAYFTIAPVLVTLAIGVFVVAAALRG